MSEERYKLLNSELGSEFDLFAIEHPDWMTSNVPAGAIVVIQTDDPAFNAWARAIAERNQGREERQRPLVLVHIRELRPAQSRILRAEAELVRS